ncbi:MAG TPA: hypothetical protein PK788_11835 [Gemmatimonadaceae bacterium]|nr:hypothetical protein [Gemmatimonadaceae bacterium]HRQ78871.1 hypothetical protein [Gemmatimonadaceae bacterium]
MKTAALWALALAGAFGGGVPSLRAVIERSAPGPDGTITVAVRGVATELRLGAYQGRLQFAPGSVAIVGSSLPSGDGTRLVNLADTAQGVVRFAGYAVPGFRSDTLLRLELRVPRGVDAAALRVELDVASDVDGKPLERSRIFDSRQRP